MDQCSCCFVDYLAKCQTEIIVNAMLLPQQLYRWVITDKFGNKYSGESVTDGDGFFTIQVSDLPAGLLTQFSGEFKLQVFDGYAACAPEKFKVAGIYDCIEFTVSGGNFVKDQLGCDFDCVASSVTSLLIPFTDVPSVTIDWTLYSDQYGNSPTVSVYHEITPGVFQLAAVDVSQTRVDGILTQIFVDNGGNATGYIIITP